MSNCARCGQVTEDHHVHICGECHEARAAEHWARLPKKKWDGEGGIYSEAYDEYCWDQEHAEYLLADHDLKSWDDLRLVICEPVYAGPLSSDRWSDDIPDEDEVPDWLEDAIEAFNKAIEGCPPLSYQPGNVAVDTSEWEIPKEDDDA